MSVDFALSISRTERLPAVEARQSWIDARGRLFAWSCATQAAGRIEVAGLGVYCFARPSRRVRAFVRPGTDTARVERLYRDVVYPLALQTRGWQALHASAVATDEGVVALCGRSGAGKSTLAQLWPELAAGPWCDDALIFRTENQRSVTRRRGGPAPPTRTLTAVVVLEPVDARAATRKSGPVLERLEPTAALRAMLPHALCLDLEDTDLTRRLFHSYADLASACRVYRLRYQQTRDGASEISRLLAARMIRSAATATAANRGPRGLR